MHNRFDELEDRERRDTVADQGAEDL